MFDVNNTNEIWSWVCPKTGEVGKTFATLPVVEPLKQKLKKEIVRGIEIEIESPLRRNFMREATRGPRECPPLGTTFPQPVEIKLFKCSCH